MTIKQVLDYSPNNNCNFKPGFDVFITSIEELDEYNLFIKTDDQVATISIQGINTEQIHTELEKNSTGSTLKNLILDSYFEAKISKRIPLCARARVSGSRASAYANIISINRMLGLNTRNREHLYFDHEKRY